MSKDLRHELLGREALCWEHGLRHESQRGETIRWVPMADLPGATIRLGLSEEGFWVAATRKSVAEFRPGSPAVFLLPVLELSVAKVRDILADGLRSAGLPIDIVAAFPFEAVVTTALLSNSEYWVKLALEWVKQLPKSDSVRESLRRVSRDGPTQAIRHAASRASRD